MRQMSATATPIPRNSNNFFNMDPATIAKDSFDITASLMAGDIINAQLKLTGFIKEYKVAAILAAPWIATVSRGIISGSSIGTVSYPGGFFGKLNLIMMVKDMIDMALILYVAKKINKGIGAPKIMKQFNITAAILAPWTKQMTARIAMEQLLN